MTAATVEAPHAAGAGSLARPRLDHVDAMRPVKQLGVVSTHSLIFFAPAASLFAGGSLMLLHVSREAFLFVSACMLAYAHPDLGRLKLKQFFKRRALSVGLPYLCWTLIYWASEIRFPVTSPAALVEHFFYLLATGFFQLYYLLVIAEFYALFPLVLLLMRATKRHPGWLLGISAAVQLALTGCMHWGLLPAAMEGTWATREISSYQFYLLAGCVAAAHLHEFNRWLVGHARLVVAATLGAAAVAEVWYVLAARHVVDWMGNASDPFQPIVLPFNIGAICTLYLLGRVLVESRRSERFRAWVMRGSDTSYGIFLSHMLVISLLVDLHWRSLEAHLPWPVVVAGAALMAFGLSALLTAALARTCLSRALTGQARLRRRRRTSSEVAAAT